MRCWPRRWLTSSSTRGKPFFQPIYDLASPQLAIGRVALLGDAAFVARPHVGAGVTKAALDAMCLADAIHAAGDNLTAALADYDRQQRQLGDWCVARGRQMGVPHQAPAAGEPEPSRDELDRRAALSIQDYRETTEDIERLTARDPRRPSTHEPACSPYACRNGLATCGS